MPVIGWNGSSLQTPMPRAIRSAALSPASSGFSPDAGHVQIGVGPQLIAKLASQQVVDRLPRRLADDVPEGHLYGGERRSRREALAPVVVRLRVDLVPDSLDIKRATPDDGLVAHLVQQMDLRLQATRLSTDPLIQTYDARVGKELDEYPVSSPDRRIDVVDDPDLVPVELWGSAR